MSPHVIHYQGRLIDGTNLVNGPVHTLFRLYDHSTAGSLLYDEYILVTSVDGLYETHIGEVPLFGSLESALNNTSVWLQVYVNGVPLWPRERVVSVPYALNAARLGGVDAELYWQVGGNLGLATNRYIGTSDYQPVELRVNDSPAIRITPTLSNWPNLIAGAGANYIQADVTGASIGGGVGNGIQIVSGASMIGGGRLNNIGQYCAGSFIGGGIGNVLEDGASRSFIGGGVSNTIRGTSSPDAQSVSRDITDGTSNTILIGEDPGGSFIGGGLRNEIVSDGSGNTIGGGTRNIIFGDGSVRFIGGGVDNVIEDGASNTIIVGGQENRVGLGAEYAVIGGGWWNTNSATGGVIPGGVLNRVDGDFGFAAGRRAQARHQGAFVWGDSQNANFASTGPNQFLIRAAGGVGINRDNPAEALSVFGNGDFIGRIFVSNGTAGAPTYSFSNDKSLGLYRPAANTLGLSTAGSERMRIASDGNVGIGLTSPGERLSVGGNTEVIGRVFVANGTAAAPTYSFSSTTNSGMFRTINNGLGFTTEGNERVRITGAGNVGVGTPTPSTDLHVRRGLSGTSPHSTAVMAVENNTNAFIQLLTPAGAFSGIYFGSTVDKIDASLRYNFLGGRELLFRSGGNTSRMVILANGNVGIGTLSPTNRLHVAGVVQATGFINSSDREAKENIQPVSPEAILDKVAALPISTWTFKDEPNGTHIGPMAQDFYEAFGLGNTDTGIMTVDADGVALAAIQALAWERDAMRKEVSVFGVRVSELEGENARLQERLEALEQALGL